MAKTPKRPRDPNQLARMVVDLATGDATESAMPETSAAAELGRLGGLKGGQARARALTAEQRADISRRAAQARWKQK